MIRNEEIYNRLNIRCGIIDRMQNKRLHYFGHLTRMQDGRYPKLALSRQLVFGHFVYDTSSTDISSTMTFLADIEAEVMGRILNQ